MFLLVPSYCHNTVRVRGLRKLSTGIVVRYHGRLPRRVGISKDATRWTVGCTGSWYSSFGSPSISHCPFSISIDITGDDLRGVVTRENLKEVVRRLELPMEQALYMLIAGLYNVSIVRWRITMPFNCGPPKSSK